MSRPASNKLFSVLASLLVLGLLVSCSQPPKEKEEDEGPPGGGSGGLYMLTGNTHGVQGLFRLDSEDGTATKLGTGITYHTGTPNVGLSGRGPNESLFGANGFDLFVVPTTGATPGKVASSCGAHGLAYDAKNDELYLSFFNNARRVDPASCAVVETLSTDRAFGGLAIDSANRTLYGIGEADGNVYALDVAAGAPYVWTAVFDTGVTGWDDAGLAFDAANELLYAVGHPTDPPGLYRIDLAAGTIEHVGDTGLAWAHGGLAWREEDD